VSESFVLTSVKGNARLELRWQDAKSDLMTVKLDFENLNASAPVYAYMKLQILTDLFANMASHWKGWSGEKSWESLEGELKLRCTSDTGGHITIQVELTSGHGHVPPTWKLGAVLVTEAGQLDTIASNFKAFALQTPAA